MQNVSYNTYCLKRRELVMDQPLPSKFEVVVIGTGLEESIIAAAAARNGHTVLHIDSNNYYGDNWASFSFEGIQEWIRQKKIIESEKRADVQQLAENLIGEKEIFHLLSSDVTVSDIREEWYARDASCTQSAEEDIAQKDAEPSGGEEAAGEVGQEVETVINESKVDKSDENTIAKTPTQCHNRTGWTKEKIALNSRQFNLDLTPRLLFSRGSMVELLISSNISRYTEFKSVSRVLTIMHGMLEHVPSSRADVFATKHVSVVEKRILMKFLTSCLDCDDHSDRLRAFEGRTFRDFLRHEKLTDNLIHFVQHSIAMVGDECPCLEGLKATQKFLASLGRFGNTPFLWSMYGSGELPQAFCRLCAVFGGVYFLGRSVDGLVLSEEDGTCKAIITGGTRIDCEKLVMPGALCPSELKKTSDDEVISRQLTLLSDSVLPTEKEQLSFISLPPKEAGSYTFMQEVGHGAAACPKEMYCFQSTTLAGDSEEDMLDVVLSDKNKKLWSLKFNVRCASHDVKVASNLHLCNGPKFELDYEESIRHSKEIFSAMYPTEDFLPRAPEPEEIIIGGQEDGEVQGGDAETQKVVEEGTVEPK